MGEYPPDECVYPLRAAVGFGLRDKPPTRYRQNRPAPGTAFLLAAAGHGEWINAPQSAGDT